MWPTINRRHFFLDFRHHIGFHKCLSSSSPFLSISSVTTRLVIYSVLVRMEMILTTSLTSPKIWRHYNIIVTCLWSIVWWVLCVWWGYTLYGHVLTTCCGRMSGWSYIAYCDIRYFYHVIIWQFLCFLEYILCCIVHIWISLWRLIMEYPNILCINIEWKNIRKKNN